MIKFNNLSNEKPFVIFKEKYEEAFLKNQENIQAVSISSFNSEKREVDSRFVNLKYVEKTNFIFFSNYNSPKSKAFSSFNQISALFFWSTINTQIRIKAKINQTSKEFNNKYFKSRSKEKNALAISSSQSQQVLDYREVIEKYNKVKKESDLKACPDYWGGFSFEPYEIEFWEGNKFRLNKRNLYLKSNKTWNHFILEP